MFTRELYQISSSVFAFYLLLGCNFLPQIVGCRLQQRLYNNMFLKHFVGFIILFFLITNVNEDTEYSDGALIKNFLITLPVYIWFFVTTRSNIYIMFANLLILCAIYIIYLRHKHYKSLEVNDDASENTDRMQTILMKVLVALNVILSAVGFAAYYQEKQREYSKKFSTSKFIFGNTTCRFYTPAQALQ